MNRNWNEPQIGNPDQMRPDVPFDIAEDYEAFDVYGTGLIFFSKTPGHRTGNANGFGFMTSAHQYGLAGGVIDRVEAQRLIDHLTSALAADEDRQ